jgi:transposase InsO family protein
LGAQPVERIGDLVEVWQDRVAELSSLPEVEYVYVFENRGVEISVTLSHPHGQICFVERFNGTMRTEKLDGEDFDSVLAARVVLREWAFEEYNNRQPNRGHGMLTPRQFADGWKAGRR